MGGDDTGAQITQVLANLQTALAAADATLADLVSMTVLVIEGTDLAAGYAVIATAMDPDRDPPLVTVARVAGLTVPGALVELSAIAAVLR